MLLFIFLGFVSLVWALLWLTFLQQGIILWRMDDKKGALIFFAFDLAVLFMFVLLLVL